MQMALWPGTDTERWVDTVLCLHRRPAEERHHWITGPLNGLSFFIFWMKQRGLNPSVMAPLNCSLMIHYNQSHWSIWLGFPWGRSSAHSSEAANVNYLLSFCPRSSVVLNSSVLTGLQHRRLKCDWNEDPPWAPLQSRTRVQEGNLAMCISDEIIGGCFVFFNHHHHNYCCCFVFF